MDTLTAHQIDHSFEAGSQDVETLIAPLVELAIDSPSLAVGYGRTQTGLRRDLIPYFHVSGTREVQQPVRALVVGGWYGSEPVTPYAVARMIAVFEARLRLVAGLEVTAYPVANLDSHRQVLNLSIQQRIDELCCWQGSSLSHIQVLEGELRRYDYDVVFLLRENVRARDADVEAWATAAQPRAIVEGAFSRYATVAPEFRWRMNPVRPQYTRSFTPIPEAEHQPVEITIGLPSSMRPYDQAREAIGLILSVSHGLRQAREEGVL